MVMQANEYHTYIVPHMQETMRRAQQYQMAEQVLQAKNQARGIFRLWKYRLSGEGEAAYRPNKPQIRYTVKTRG